MSNDRYTSPLSERYASKEMQYIFSPDKKFRTWRKLWIALAETEKELGLDITDEQIEELKAHADDINYDVAKEREKVVRHDVMPPALGRHAPARVHQCGLSGSVLSHKCMYFTAFHFEINMIQGMNSRKGLINILHS